MIIIYYPIRLTRLDKLFLEIHKEKGRKTEEKARELLEHLLKTGRIKEIIPVNRSSWMENVCKIDIIVTRLDSAHVPIQIKTSFAGVKAFEARHLKLFIKHFRDKPVFIVIGPSQGWRHKAHPVIQAIRNWNGRFYYEPWQIEYNEFLDFDLYKQRFGKNLAARVSAVLRNRNNAG